MGIWGVLAVGVCAGLAGAQAGEAGVFQEPATGLTMRYPVEMVVQDAQKAIREGHVAAFGSIENEAKEHELAGRCMKPILLAELPEEPSGDGVGAKGGTTTLFFFEFFPTKECKAGFKYKDDERVAGGVAQIAIQLPGATALSPPLWLDCGKQKLHMTFAAFGTQNKSADEPHALMLTAAMRYHGHILGWVLSSGYLNTFNDLTKTSIQLDDGKTYPMVPFNLDEQLRLPVTPVK